MAKHAHIPGGSPPPPQTWRFCVDLGEGGLCVLDRFGPRLGPFGAELGHCGSFVAQRWPTMVEHGPSWARAPNRPQTHTIPAPPPPPTPTTTATTPPPPPPPTGGPVLGVWGSCRWIVHFGHLGARSAEWWPKMAEHGPHRPNLGPTCTRCLQPPGPQGPVFFCFFGGGLSGISGPAAPTFGVVFRSVFQHEALVCRHCGREQEQEARYAFREWSAKPAATSRCDHDHRGGLLPEGWGDWSHENIRSMSIVLRSVSLPLHIYRP